MTAGCGPARSGGRTLLVALTVGVIAPSVAGAVETEIVPGVTYERIAYTDPQVVHVIRATPNPLIQFRPILTGGAPSRRGRMTDAMHARLGAGAVAAVNGDFFNLERAYPSGVLVIDNELISEPEPTRAALAFTSQGGFAAARLKLTGGWQTTDAAGALLPVRPFTGMNRPSEQNPETVVFTSKFGAPTPTATGRVDALVALDLGARARPNTTVGGTVLSVTSGGDTRVGPGQIVISGTGLAGPTIQSELVAGRRVSVTFGIEGFPAGSTHGLGGGPVLVSNGVAVQNAGEGFSAGQVNSRVPRTAIGQRADGTVVLVAIEGPAHGSIGTTAAGFANFLTTLGVHTAVAMDSGGSARMAIRDRLVGTPASERSITDAFMVTYAGVQLTPPQTFISPNGDGTDDATSTVVRATKNGTATVYLTNLAGRSLRVLYSGRIGPAGKRVTVNRTVLKKREGRFLISARFTPSDGSGRTSHRHRITVDRTVGFLRVDRVGKGKLAKLRVRFTLTRPTSLTVRATTPDGVHRKSVLRPRVLGSGSHEVLWDMRQLNGKLFTPGRYVMRLEAATPVGSTTLRTGFRMVTP